MFSSIPTNEPVYICNYTRNLSTLGLNFISWLYVASLIAINCRVMSAYTNKILELPTSNNLLSVQAQPWEISQKIRIKRIGNIRISKVSGDNSDTD